MRPPPAIAWLLHSVSRFIIAFAALFASGAAWLTASQLKEASNGEIWQQAAAYLLMVHGGAAMLTLMLLGPAFPCILAAPGAVSF